MEKTNKYHAKVWTEDKKQWLIENTKGMNRNEALELYTKAFPNEPVTINAISGMRSRLRVCEYCLNHPSTKRKPLYSMRKKSGYWDIKVAQPSTWWSMSKFVWIETHPEELDTLLETDAFYYADGNNENFSYDNIIRVHRNEQTIFIAEGGVIKGDPEATKLNLLRAKIKLAQLDAGERAGLVVKHGNLRMFREELNEKVRLYHKKKYNEDPEYKAKFRQKQKEYRLNRTDEQKEHYKEYRREWARRKREKDKK